MPTFNGTILEDTTEMFLATRIAVVETYVGTTPIEADLVTAAEGASPGVLSVVVIDEVTIRINFVSAAIDNQALRSLDNYVITPTLNVYSVTPEAVATPTYVDLVIDEQKTGVDYDVELQRIEAA